MGEARWCFVCSPSARFSSCFGFWLLLLPALLTVACLTLGSFSAMRHLREPEAAAARGAPSTVLCLACLYTGCWLARLTEAHHIPQAHLRPPYFAVGVGRGKLVVHFGAALSCAPAPSLADARCAPLGLAFSGPYHSPHSLSRLHHFPPFSTLQFSRYG